MIKKIFGRKWVGITVFCLLSFLAGGINGFLGTGGGIIFVYMLSFLTDNEKKDNFATSLCATAPISLIGLISYFSSGNVDTELIRIIILPTVLGGLLGAFLVDRLKVRWLSALFACLVIYSGFRLIMR